MLEREELYEKYAPLIYGVIFRFTNDGVLANKVLEVSFKEIYKQLPSYQATNCRLFTWIIRIVLYECSAIISIPRNLIKLRMIQSRKQPK